jgi:hypothetical protein
MAASAGNLGYLHLLAILNHEWGCRVVHLPVIKSQLPELVGADGEEITLLPEKQSVTRATRHLRDDDVEG